jgi:hypothetical protein
MALARRTIVAVNAGTAPPEPARMQNELAAMGSLGPHVPSRHWLGKVRSSKGDWSERRPKLVDEVFAHLFGSPSCEESNYADVSIDDAADLIVLALQRPSLDVLGLIGRDATFIAQGPPSGRAREQAEADSERGCRVPMRCKC